MDLVNLFLTHWQTLTQHGSLALVLVAVWLSRRELAVKLADDAKDRKRLAKLMRLHSDRHPETARWPFDDEDEHDPPPAAGVK